MLKGYLSCAQAQNNLIGFIHYDLERKTMKKTAIHLRNCPICMEKYSSLQRRKKELREKLYEIQNKLKIENDVSCYIDCETEKENLFLINELIKWDEKYKKEYKEQLNLKNFMQYCKLKVRENLIKENIKNKSMVKKDFKGLFGDFFNNNAMRV